MSDVSFKLVSRSVHSSFFYLVCRCVADITVRFSVFLDGSEVSFFIKFQACLIDRARSMFFVCFLEGMLGIFQLLYRPDFVRIPSVVLKNVLFSKVYIVLCVLLECITALFGIRLVVFCYFSEL